MSYNLNLVGDQKDERCFSIDNIFEVIRLNEHLNFAENIPNQRLLYHGSKAGNFLGILSRGLLLPKYVTDLLGDEMRSDIGSLGAGIYFADNAMLSLSYCQKPGSNETIAYICVCEVALGNSKEYTEHDGSLIAAPEGYQSALGVKGSAFTENEYVIYDTKQYRLKYLVELREIGTEADELKYEVETEEQSMEVNEQSVKMDPEPVVKKQKKVDEVQAGLKSSSGQDLPLRSVHVRAKVLDMIGQVTIYQEYENNEAEAIEAKYVFPLTDQACVCGFEAFINEKRLVGVCKEKQQARREYKEAIEQGKGAYLMDQETVEVFTVNIGNLPKNSR